MRSYKQGLVLSIVMVEGGGGLTRLFKNKLTYYLQVHEILKRKIENRFLEKLQQIRATKLAHVLQHEYKI